MKVVDIELREGLRVVPGFRIERKDEPKERTKFKKWLDEVTPPAYPFIIHEAGTTFRFESPLEFFQFCKFRTSMIY